MDLCGTCLYVLSTSAKSASCLGRMHCQTPPVTRCAVEGIGRSTLFPAPLHQGRRRKRRASGRLWSFACVMTIPRGQPAHCRRIDPDLHGAASRANHFDKDIVPNRIASDFRRVSTNMMIPFSSLFYENMARVKFLQSHPVNDQASFVSSRPSLFANSVPIPRHCEFHELAITTQRSIN